MFTVSVILRVQNSAPLIASNKARTKHGLPLISNPDGTALRYDHLVPQRLAAPVEVFVEQFSAHPLEQDAAELYGPPDGYADSDGVFHEKRQNADDKPVYKAILRPQDGLYLLPYMALQAGGKPWDDDWKKYGVRSLKLTDKEKHVYKSP